MKGKKKNPNQLKIKNVGTLSVPFSQGQFSQLLMWLQQGNSETHLDKQGCPIDLSVLPDSPPEPLSMRDGEVFYVFREISVTDNDERNEIVFHYDRMRVESGGVEETPYIHHGEHDNELVQSVAERINNDHGIVLSQALLERLQRENPSLRGVSDVDTFIQILNDRGLFRTSPSTYITHLTKNSQSVHLTDKNK